MRLFSVILASSLLALANSSQLVLQEAGQGWSVKLSESWDVLGPFPIHAREQHFLSPSFPINLSEPIDFDQAWPSSYADGGNVSWGKTQLDRMGNLKVSFPSIRWNVLRATEGWAALQHHALLHASLTVYPPQGFAATSNPCRLLVSLEQGSFFTVLPKGDSRLRHVPKWYSGNIYATKQAQPQAVELPTTPSTSSPTAYDLYVSGDYEIRLFGDPVAYESDVPIQSINVAVEIEEVYETVTREPLHDVSCNFIDGYAFGNALGIGLRSTSGWWTVTKLSTAPGVAEVMNLTLLSQPRIAPTQIRVIPIRIVQASPFRDPEINLELTVESEHDSHKILVHLPVKHQAMWDSSNASSIMASYFYAETMATSFIVVPPTSPNLAEPRPPILALHGAGVDIINPFWSFWVDTLPRQEHSWLIIPSGRTPWGLDWHGPSAQDVWGSLDALVDILQSNQVWHPWKLISNTPAIVIGHSNGGQGAWYVASRYPDRVLAVVAAAGYIKSQAYVPLTMSRSAHFIDPALRAILESSLTPDDNDLYLSNLANMPVLAIHGGDDDNVPTWHTREAVSVLETWQPDANVSYLEDAGKPHWYPTVLNEKHVQDFLEQALTSHTTVRTMSKSFTLTVTIPAESGPLHGWQIVSVEMPGRLARLHVEDKNGAVHVRTTNVQSFSIDLRIHVVPALVIDGARIELLYSEDQFMSFEGENRQSWKRVASTSSLRPQSSGRIQAVLTSAEALIIVIQDGKPSHELSIALRIAHDLHLYHKLDAQIIESSDAIQRLEEGRIGPGNIIVIGDANTPFVANILSQDRTPFGLHGSSITLSGRPLTGEDLGFLFLHPHPTHSQAKLLFIAYTDASGLERAARLFPIRTGVAVPDWLIIGEGADQLGAAGVMGAGVWGRQWELSEGMSWMY